MSPTRSGLTRRALVLGAVGALSGATRGLADSAALARDLAARGAALTGTIPQGCEANLAAIADAWMRDTGIPVDLRVVPFDGVPLSLTMAALSGGHKPDFALPPTFALPDLALSGLLRSHDRIAAEFDLPMIEDDGLYTRGDEVAGQRFGIQTDGDVYLMFYRADMRSRHAARYEDRFGTELVQPTTWPEVDRQMAFFHRPERDQFGGALFRTRDFALWEFWSRMHAKGALPFDRELMPLLHHEAGVEALEQMVRATAHLHPKTATANLFENWTLFLNSDIYCCLGWGGSQKVFNAPGSHIRDKLSFGRLPGEHQAHSSFFNWGWSYVVPTGAERPALGCLFSTYATSRDISVQAIRARDGFFDPFRAEHYADPVIRSIYSKPFLDVHRDALATAIPDLYLPGYGAFASSLALAIEDAITGRMTPEQALIGASERWQIELLARDRERMVEKWRNLLSLYPPTFDKDA